MSGPFPDATAIERRTLAAGFRVLLVAARLDPERCRVHVLVRLLDGGRMAGEWRGDAELDRLPEGLIEALRRFLVKVMAPPHVLVGWGNGWIPLLVRLQPAAVLRRLRVLDLRRAALALAPDLPARAPGERMFARYGVPLVGEADDPLNGAAEDLFWAVLAVAGRAGLDWPGLLRRAAEPRAPTPFDRYEFNAEAIATLPDAPAVYRLLDAAGRTVYVGKTDRLRRRMMEHFRPGDAIAAKTACLREATRALEYRLVGSEPEAMLLEHEWIARLQPPLNVQRGIRHAGAVRRRPAAHFSICVVAPSAVRGAVEAFAWSRGGEAWQVTIRPGRPPAKTMARIYATLTGAAPHPRGVGLKVWGRTGAEILDRCWRSRKHRLHWFAVDGLANAAEFESAVIALARRALDPLAAPAEYRFGLPPPPPTSSVGSSSLP